MNGDLASLIRKLERLIPEASDFSGKTFRSATPHYATEKDLLTGEGSRRFGGRWNPPGLAAVYASLTPETAMAETLAHARYFGLSEYDAMPRTFVAISVDLSSVLDLTDGKVRQRLAFSLKRIVETDWRKETDAGKVPFTQWLGHAAADVGFEALLVPSAAEANGRNIVAFPPNFHSTSAAMVVAPGKL
jgi:RES domain-containing protein